jgi:hypothetical protein
MTRYHLVLASAARVRKYPKPKFYICTASQSSRCGAATGLLASSIAGEGVGGTAGGAREQPPEGTRS